MAPYRAAMQKYNSSGCLGLGGGGGCAHKSDLSVSRNAK